MRERTARAAQGFPVSAEKLNIALMCVVPLKSDKVVPVLFNLAPCHEGMLGEWKYSSTDS